MSEDDIKPGIIIQNAIDEDYKFTLYTDDKSGNIKIDLFSKRDIKSESEILPHTFTYNKKTGELTYNSIQMANATVTYNEDMNIIDSSPIQENLSENKNIFNQLIKLCKNVEVIEREFGAPQDIEGGLKDDDIYIWQTRNIVNY